MDQSLSVLYQDEAILIVDKPAGMHTAPNEYSRAAPLGAGEPDTLLALVVSAFPEISRVPGRKPGEHGLLHRLDRETSGLVVIARTPGAFAALRQQFSSGLAGKEYRALCACPPGDSRGIVTVTSRFAPSGPGRRTVRVVQPEERSRKLLRAATRSVYSSEARVLTREGDRALVGVTIRKGFRHQIRAHLSHAGWPIFGDPLYGVPVPPEAPQRMYLHAHAISLTHPVTGKQLQVVSPLPEEFTVFFGMIPNM